MWRCCYVHMGWHCMCMWNVFEYSTNAIQLICLYSKNDNLIMCTLYGTPNDGVHGNPSTTTDFKLAMMHLMDVLTGFSPFPDIIIRGDFNLPHVSWSSVSPAAGASTEEQLMLYFLSKFSNTLLVFLHQMFMKNPGRVLKFCKCVSHSFQTCTHAQRRSVFISRNYSSKCYLLF